MDLFEVLKERALQEALFSERELEEPRRRFLRGMDAAFRAVKEVIRSRTFWDWIMEEYDGLEWADDVNPKDVKRGRIWAIQMLGLVIKLLGEDDDRTDTQEG